MVSGVAYDMGESGPTGRAQCAVKCGNSHTFNGQYDGGQSVLRPVGDCSEQGCLGFGAGVRVAGLKQVELSPGPAAAKLSGSNPGD
jgi:hypothetical protein